MPPVAPADPGREATAFPSAGLPGGSLVVPEEDATREGSGDLRPGLPSRRSSQ